LAKINSNSSNAFGKSIRNIIKYLLMLLRKLKPNIFHQILPNLIMMLKILRYHLNILNKFMGNRNLLNSKNKEMGVFAIKKYLISILWELGKLSILNNIIIAILLNKRKKYSNIKVINRILLRIQHSNQIALKHENSNNHNSKNNFYRI
jgi:hypothetical protein